MPMPSLEKNLQQATVAVRAMARLDARARCKLVRTIARMIRREEQSILAANAKDVRSCTAADPMRDRLLLTHKRIAAMADDVEHVANLPDHLGKIYDCRKQHGLNICKKHVPFGVIGVIYESRPNVTIDVASLCLKSGNACILKGGKEAMHSNIALVNIVRAALREQKISPYAVQLLDPEKPELVQQLITANRYVDLVIPRGGAGLIRYIRDHATVPVIETGAGVCHVFVDATANVEKSAAVVVNAKIQRPSVCNALDTLLVHHVIAKTFLPVVAKELAAHNVKIFADAKSFSILKKYYPKNLLHRASAEDFGREFLSLQMSVKIVDDIDMALKHITKYSSKHSESILTNNKENAERFLQEVDAAAVYVNASTRFTDGAMFGLGAEIGISTQKMHARGPMGPGELTTYKWIIRGHYTVRA